MKKFKILFFFFPLCFPLILSAQDVQKEMIINDLLLISEQFAKPAAMGAAYQGSAGWFSSATALEPWELSLSIHANALIVPGSKKTFSISNSELEALNIAGAERATIPTAFGSKSQVVFEGQYLNFPFAFRAFEGIDRDIVPHAFVQVAVGLPGGTDITLRVMPEITIDNINAKTYGAGIKHSISQYFNYNYPHQFQLAAGLAYSKFLVDYTYPPVNIQIATLETIDVNADVLVLEAIGSKLYGDFELVGALGVINTSFNYELGGEGFGLKEINTELEKLGDTKIQYKADLGFNLHFGRIKLSAMATVGSLFNANLGLHVRI